MKIKIWHIVVGMVLAGMLVSCDMDADFEQGSSGKTQSQEQPGRLPSEETRQVMILYSAGFNSLSKALAADIEELSESFLPSAQSRADHILLIFSRQAQGSYSQGVAPVLYRLYKDARGTVVRDTLVQWNPTDQATDPEILNEVMTYAHDKYPAKGYGLVFSSHAAGWVPAVKATKVSISLTSVGQDADTGLVNEMELHEFVAALPYKLNYVLFDACFMGCVEVAWALKDKAELVGFSPTEIMSDGFDYSTLTTHLLASTPDVKAVCEDYFAQYTSPEQPNPYATITLVQPGEMQALADICKTLFEKYRSSISLLTTSQVQRYYRQGLNARHEHLFDLRDMLSKAGASAQEMAQFDQALAACVLYEAHTEKFISLMLNNVCGLSVYLPSSGDASLNSFYATYIDWNNATNLI